ncbi:MAG: CDP-alcohol phosphatidyltransferase family protein [Planctomycetes bacterium]|nr:CDP-alcohol phosphatidyltransferase family protein [Planctomycetota bacterium]
MRKIHLLPNLITLGNSFCGLLAIAKGIDALAFAQTDPGVFYSKMESACWLIFVGMLFDAFDGKVARMVGGSSAFGAQLDSFSDMLSFGIAPAVLAKILIEHEGPAFGYTVHPRLHFVAAAVFSIMAILRLARFNLETEPDESAHQFFKGLPSPGAAGALCSSMLMYLVLRDPGIENSEGSRTPLGMVLSSFPDLSHSHGLVWFLPFLALCLPGLGFLMVSRVRYVHMTSFLAGRGQFVTLVVLVVAAFCLYTAPVLAMFLVFNVYVIAGLLLSLRKRPQTEAEAGA